MIDRLRLIYATEIFLKKARREYVSRFPGKTCEIKPLEEYPKDQQEALIQSIKLAVTATDPKSNTLFEDWKLDFLSRQTDQ